MAITTINESDLIKDSRTVINSNFTELDTLKAPLASPALTGAPTAPTPNPGDDSTKLATTEYVQEEIRTHANLPVGFEYFSPNPNIPQGSLPLFGGEYSRDTYSALWEWVQEQTGYCKTEAEWQTLATAHNGNVPYYSSGDGSTTFRVPSLKCWVKGANGTVSEVGSYLAAGLPNVTGNLLGATTLSAVADGALGWEQTDATNYAMTYQSGSMRYGRIKFDASNSDSIYGNSSTVQPESIVGMWLVKAYGTIVDTGTIDEQQYIDDRIAALPNTFLPLTGGAMTGDIEFYDNLFLGSPLEYGSDVKSIFAGLYSNKNNPHKYGGISFVNALTGATRPQFNISAGDGTHRSFLVGFGDDNPYLTFKSIAISVSAVGSNYIRYDNGLQICWGTTANTVFSANAQSSVHITYPVAFANTGYSFNFITRFVSGSWEPHTLCINGNSTTGVDAYIYQRGGAYTAQFMWMAIGLWK